MEEPETHVYSCACDEQPASEVDDGDDKLHAALLVPVLELEFALALLWRPVSREAILDSFAPLPALLALLLPFARSCLLLRVWLGLYEAERERRMDCVDEECECLRRRRELRVGAGE